MCHVIPQYVWNYDGKDLDGIQTAILSRLAWYAGWDGANIYPSISTLSEQTKFSISTIKRVLKYLRDHDFLIIDAEANRGTYTSTKYRINFDKIKMPVPKDLQKRHVPSPVDKSANSIPPGVTQTLARVTQTPDPGVTQTPNKLYTTNYLKNIMLKGEKSVDKIDSRVKEFGRKLTEAGIDSRSIQSWVKEFGLERVISIWSDVSNTIKEKPSGIKNKGAYFRAVMMTLKPEVIPNFCG